MRTVERLRFEAASQAAAQYIREQVADYAAALATRNDPEQTVKIELFRRLCKRTAALTYRLPDAWLHDYRT